MASYLTQLCALTAVIAPIFAAPAPSAGHFEIRTPDVAERDVVLDAYIVVYNAGVNSTMVASHMESVSSLLSKRDATGGVGATYDMDSFAGYAITADATTIGAIASSPEVSIKISDLK